jgi:hypothetical protein
LKFVSVYPLFRLVDFEDDKLNKFSVKDRAKFIVQLFQHLWAGLKSDEAANFHQQLVGAYFEALAFIFIKRFQPYWEKLDEKQKEDDFVFVQLKVVLETPILDYINKYQKLSSEALNYKNTRHFIPENYCRMLKNLCDKDLTSEIQAKVLSIL